MSHPLPVIEATIIAGQRGKSAYQYYTETTTDDPVLTEAEWIAATNAAKDEAESSATAAANSATLATGAVAQVSASATAAETSAADASVSALAASNSASNAANIAAAVATSESNAATHASNALTRANNAAASEANAADDADKVAADKITVASDKAAVEADKITVAGSAAQVSVDALQVADDATQVAGDAAQVADDATQVAGDAAQVASDATQVSTDASQVAADKATITTLAGEVSTDRATVQGMATQVSSDAATVAADKSTVATNTATATTQAGNASSSAASALGYKTDAEAALAAIEMVNAAGHVGFFTLAALNADLAHPEGTLGEVVLDDVDPEINNAVYIKNGASGAGSWSKTNYSQIATSIIEAEKRVLAVEERLKTVTPNPSTGLLMIGGDHPYLQWYGATNDGMGKMHKDRGIVPYLAINTDDHDGPGGQPIDAMSWAQLKALSDAGDIFVTSHGHNHIRNWSRIDCGIEISYDGADASGTFGVTSTGVDLVSATEGTHALTFAAYPTMVALQTAVNALSGWSMVYADILKGSERSGSLMTIAAQTILAGESRRYSCCGGVNIIYNGSDFEDVVMRVSGTTGLRLYGDGVEIHREDFAGRTIEQVRAGFDGLTDIVCNLNDNLNITGEVYTSGLEDAVNLGKNQDWRSIVQTETRFDGDGLNPRYVIQRQIEKSVEVAAANGIKIEHFTQSGAGFWQGLASGLQRSVAKSFRGNGQFVSNAPFAQPHGSAFPSTFYGHRGLGKNAGEYTTPGRVEALVEAIATSPDHHVCMLMHKVTPDGSSGYTLQDNDRQASADQMEANYVTFLDKVQELQDAGEIQVVNPDQLLVAKRTRREPDNYLFNSALKNSGESLLGFVSNIGYVVPGWALRSNAPVTAMTITDGVMEVETNAITSFSPITQDVFLPPGLYRFGCDLEVLDYSSGSGVTLTQTPSHGRLSNTGPDDPVASRSSATYRNSNQMVYEFRVPEPDAIPTPFIKGQIKAPFDLSSGYNLRINGAALGLTTDIDCRGATPSATTVQEVCDAINTFLVSHPNYGSDYANVARPQDDKVRVELPFVANIADRTLDVVTGTTANGVANIFGSNLLRGAAPRYRPIGEQAPLRASISVSMIGKFRLSNPFIERLRVI